MLEFLTEQAQDGLYTLDERGVVDFCNDSFARNLGYEPHELRGEHAKKTLAPGELEKGQRAIAELLDANRDSTTVDLTFQRKDGERREISIHFTVLYDESGDYSGLMGVTRDITEQRERQQELAAQRDELATLAQVHVLMQDVLRALGAVATRTELEATVCERIVESDLYQFAWIGEREGASTKLTPRTLAGEDDSFLETVADRIPPDDGPAATAMQTGEVKFVQDVETDERAAAWRELALERDFRSVVVVPLTHDDAIHGVLAVYANKPEAFRQRAVEAFTVLGEMVGFAFTAVQNRQLLAYDRVTEMAFRSSSEDAYPLGIAAEHDCTFRRAGSVDIDDEFLEYLTVEGAEPAVVIDSLVDHELVLDGRVVRADGDSGVVELRAVGSYQSVLLDAGVKPVEITADGDAVRIVVEAPPDAEPRTILETLSERAPGFEFVSKGEVSSHSTAEPETPPLRDALTNRQREVLRAAYLAGYYEWPRDTTAEQLAETLGIASSTLHQHLRRANRNILSELADT